MTKMIFFATIFAVVAAIIAVGLIDLVKAFLPKNFPTRAKVVVAIIVEAVIGLLASLLWSKTIGGDWLDKATIIIATIGIANVGYNYIAKLFESIELKLRN